MAIGDDEIVIIVLCAAVFVFAVVILLVWVWRRQRTLKTPKIKGGADVDMTNTLSIISPPPGLREYPAPLVVHLTPKVPQCEVYVKIVHESNSLFSYYANRANDDISVFEDNEVSEEIKDRLMGYLLVKDPLTLVKPGGYIIRVHSMLKENGVQQSEVTNHHYTVVAPGVTPISSPPPPGLATLQPPRIIPDAGEVTTLTMVQIVLAGTYHTGREYIVYSTDNSFPSIVYTGPITLAVPKGSNSAEYVIKAVAADGTSASDVSVATLTVLRHDSLTYDRTIPAPTAQVDAIGAMLYFESPVEPSAVIHYTLESEGRKGKGDAETEVYLNKAIRLPVGVKRILAWTVPKSVSYSDDSGLKRSHSAIYDVYLQKVVNSGSGKSSRRCLPPVICVTCSDLFLTFDTPPSCFRLLYTLDGSEPSIAEDSLSTIQHTAGAKPIDVSKCSEDTVVVTARYFSPTERGSTRFGDKFLRSFHFGAAK